MFPKISYEDLKPFESGVQVVPNKEFRQKAVFGNYVSHLIFLRSSSVQVADNLSGTVSDIIKYLALRRENGATQAEISKKMNIDPRCAFHYVKQALATGLVYVC